MVTRAAATAEAYLESLPLEQRTELAPVLAMVRRSMPKGYEESTDAGMICWQVPLSRYPDTYNRKPLMYVALAAQKRHLALYLMGCYMDGPATAAIRAAFEEAGLRLDMGKACIRFRRAADLPLAAIGKQIRAMTVEKYLTRYEAARAR